MKIMAASDSHGTVSALVDAVELEKPDLMIFLGDGWQDVDRLMYALPKQRIERVPGNCDLYADAPYERLIIENGRRIFFCHGHTKGVKSGLQALTAHGKRLKADIILYGHTHRPYCSYDGTTWIMNPGSMSRFEKQTYGLIHIDENSCTCEIKSYK